MKKQFPPKDRKQMRVFTGLLKYFPNACNYVGYVSYVANSQHNKGEAMHWAEDKSIGTGDEIVRHLIDDTINQYDEDGLLHLGKVAWRSLELLERRLRKLDK